jgi:hypothetical protein
MPIGTVRQSANLHMIKRMLQEKIAIRLGAFKDVLHKRQYG